MLIHTSAVKLASFISYRLHSGSLMLSDAFVTVTNSQALELRKGRVAQFFTMCQDHRHVVQAVEPCVEACLKISGSPALARPSPR